MTMEPLRSTLSYVEVGETSLALPSDGHSGGGQRRVMEQVSTMRKSKSKYSSRGSSGTLSPTSPKSDSVFSPSNLNGSEFLYESTLANGNTKMRKQHSVMQRSVSTRSANYSRMQNNTPMLHSHPTLSQPNVQHDAYAGQMGYKCSSGHWTQQHRQSKSLDRNYSHPPLISPLPMAINSFQGTSNQFHTINRRPPSAHSNSEPKLSGPNRTKIELNELNGEAAMSEMRLEDAISCVSQVDEAYQLHGASVIQHKTFTDEATKEQVRKQNGIPPLVSLLNSPNPQIQLTAASALRNIVYKNSANKEEVRRAGGVNHALQLLQKTSSAELKKHVTGLLWNLSSEESIQPELLRQGLPILTQTVLKPNADTSEIGSDIEARTESFCNATACLRNLSSGKLANRQALRNSEGLIDSLSTHIQSSVDSGTLDDKSVENSVCVLHNLTYQLESEVPDIFSKINRMAMNFEGRTGAADTGPIGCFSNQSRKLQELNKCDYPLIDDFNAKDKSRLIHSKTLKMYLNLLGSSQNENTKVACSGALTNLTAKKGFVSDVLSNTIVQKLNGLQSITPHLNSDNSNLKNSATTLIGNLSRTPQLHQSLARQALPEVIKTLTSDSTLKSDSAMATACHTAHNLLRAEPEMGKRLLNNNLIAQLSNISQNQSMPMSSKAAGLLLHSLWSDKTFQSFFKKQGIAKNFFVNELTSQAARSLQIVD